MDSQIVNALIVGGAAIFASLLSVGVIIIFHTKSFEEEYSDKIRLIKFNLKNSIDSQVIGIVNRVNQLVRPHTTRGVIATIEISNIPEEISHELFDVQESQELMKKIGEHNDWCKFLVHCKSIIRRIGGSVILIGLFSLLL